MELPVKHSHVVLYKGSMSALHWIMQLIISSLTMPIYSWFLVARLEGSLFFARNCLLSSSRLVLVLDVLGRQEYDCLCPTIVTPMNVFVFVFVYTLDLSHLLCKLRQDRVLRALKGPRHFATFSICHLFLGRNMLPRLWSLFFSIAIFISRDYGSLRDRQPCFRHAIGRWGVILVYIWSAAPARIYDSSSTSVLTVGFPIRFIDVDICFCSLSF